MAGDFFFEVSAGRVPNHEAKRMNWDNIPHTQVATDSEFTIPDDQTGFVIGIYASALIGNEWGLQMQSSAGGGTWTTFRSVHVSQGVFDHKFALPVKVKSGITIRVRAIATAPQNVSGGYDMILIDDTKSVSTAGL